MTKTKSTKRALLTSALALLMCVSMLIGSTFAWFTDSVTSNGNIIQAGNLNVEMYWAEGDEDPATVTWTKVDGAIFNNEKWEPGYVEAKHVKITNEGNLAFKWRLRIVPNGTVEELADVIDVYYIEGAQQLTREMLEGVAPVCTLRDLINDVDGAAHGALLPAGETATDAYERVGEVTATLAFKMREEAGNEYQGKKIGTDFSLQLMATQYTYEDDSFNNQYDVNAEADYWDGTVDESWYDETATELVITTAEELAAFAAQVNSGNTFEGKTVKLDQDIDLINKEWTPIGNSSPNPFKGTFDGQNHTISNMAIAKQNEYIGLFGYVNNAVIKNLTVDNASITATGNSVYAAVIVGYHNQADGVATTIDHVTVNNAKIDVKATTTYVGGIFGYCSKGNMSVANSIINGLKITSNATGGNGGVGGLIGYTYKVDPLKVENVNITGLDIDFIGKSSKVGGVTGRDESISRDNGGYKNVSVSGTIDENASAQTSSEVGGFVGISYQYPKTYTGCSAAVDVNTKYVGGGFTGSSCVNLWGGQYDTYINCSASGDVTAQYAGGFIAYSINHSSYVTLKDITVSGKIHGTAMAGGITATTVGNAKSITITNAKITGTITGGTVAGVCANALMANGNTLTLTNVESTATPLVIGSADKVVIN